MDQRQQGSDSNIFRIVVQDTSTGGPRTGLLYNTSGLVIGIIGSNWAAPFVYDADSGGTEDITGTLGTYQAPTHDKIRVKLVDETIHPGLMELHVEDGFFNVDNETHSVITFTGANCLANYEVQWVSYDPYTSTPATPNDVRDATLNATAASFNTAGSIGNKINTSGSATDPLTNTDGTYTTPGTVGYRLVNNVNATVSSRSTYAGTDTAGTTTLLGRIPSGLTITSGKVDVNDKTNFQVAGDFSATMKTSLNAATPAVTVSDKTGFALTAAYDAAKTAAQAGNAMALTSGERTTLTGLFSATLSLPRNGVGESIPFFMRSQSNLQNGVVGTPIITVAKDAGGFGATAGSWTSQGGGYGVFVTGSGDLNAKLCRFKAVLDTAVTVVVDVWTHT